MNIVVIGGTGLIGSKTVERLRRTGHDVLAASPSSGVDTITGQGLGEALAGAQVVIDLANSRVFDDKTILAFFETSSGNLLAAAMAAGVEHYIALSIRGAERLPESGYLRAKMAQEKLIRESGIPYTIVHSTPFFAFRSGFAQSATARDTGTFPTAHVQPIASDGVADIMAEVALSAPANGVVEIAGSEAVCMNEIAAKLQRAGGDRRKMVSGDNPRSGTISLADWFNQVSPARPGQSPPRPAGCPTARELRGGH